MFVDKSLMCPIKPFGHDQHKKVETSVFHAHRKHLKFSNKALLWPQQHWLRSTTGQLYLRCQWIRLVSAKQTESLCQEGASLTAPRRNSLHDTPTETVSPSQTGTCPTESMNKIVSSLHRYTHRVLKLDNNDQTCISVLLKHQMLWVYHRGIKFVT